MFNFQTSSSGITGYTWTFYAVNSTSTVLSTSTLSHPTMTYSVNGSYQVKLVITYGTGCSQTFWKSLTVSNSCPGCTESNPVSPDVKQLYINLVNHMLAMGTNVSNPYTCAELEALSPYITDNNPQIWNVSVSGGVLKFSFNDHGTEFDVSVELT